MTAMESFRAVVLGATGAIGREVVAELTGLDSCAQILVCSRRPLSKEDDRIDRDHEKITVQRVNYDTLNAADFQQGSLPTAVFCCLGTTRKDAGSAEAFRLVDYTYVVKAAEVTKTLEWDYFGLVSASNANATSYFLYPKTKGEAEDAVKDLKLLRTSIFQPGLLDRGPLSRTLESIGLWLLPSVSVRTVAKAMVSDYLHPGPKMLNVISHQEMKQFET